MRCQVVIGVGVVLGGEGVLERKEVLGALGLCGVRGEAGGALDGRGGDVVTWCDRGPGPGGVVCRQGGCAGRVPSPTFAGC